MINDNVYFLQKQEGTLLMENIEYHKGSFCVYTPIFCQEGYCATCEIYTNSLFLIKSEKHSAVETLDEAAKNNQFDAPSEKMKQGRKLGTLTR
jgi:ferredoxin